MWENPFPKSLGNIKLFQGGLNAHKLGDFKNAVKIFKRLIQNEPEISSSWYMLLESLSYLGKWGEMIEIGSKAIEIHPNIGPCYSWLGDAYNQLGKKKQARECYKKGLNLLLNDLKNYPKEDKIFKNTILNSIGEVYIRLGNYEESIKFNQKAININTNEHNLHSIGLAYKESGDFSKAIEFYKKSLIINPEHSYAWFDLGLIYEQLRESEKAIECFEKAVECSPQWVKLRKKLIEIKPDSLALLKDSPDIGTIFDDRLARHQEKTDLILKELNEIEIKLKDPNLSNEEHEYYSRRKHILKKEIELDKVVRSNKLAELKNLLSESKELLMTFINLSRQGFNRERQNFFKQKLKDLAKDVEVIRGELYETEKNMRSIFKISPSDLSQNEIRLLWELMKISTDDPNKLQELKNQEVEFFEYLRMVKKREELFKELNIPFDLEKFPEIEKKLIEIIKLRINGIDKLIRKEQEGVLKMFEQALNLSPAHLEDISKVDLDIVKKILMEHDDKKVVDYLKELREHTDFFRDEALERFRQRKISRISEKESAKGSQVSTPKFPPTSTLRENMLKKEKKREREFDVELREDRKKQVYSPEDLRKEYDKYKEKKYRFGKYRTREQILDEFFKGKIFVLKGGLSIRIWILTILMFAISSISLYALLLPDPDLGVFIIPFILTFSTGLLSILTLRNFLVIGPTGAYYRKALSSGFFSWDKVDYLIGSTQAYMSSTWALVTIYFFSGKKIKFGSNTYHCYEFQKNVKKKMFFTLFNIYSQRRINRIEIL